MKKQKLIRKVKSITRYPGGKSRSLKMMKEFLEIPHDEYREPFLGGGSVFLSKDKVEKNWINDYDTDIYSMHKTIQDDPNTLIEMIEENTPPTLESYNKIKENDTGGVLWKGFRALFLNRCSFNGMPHGGPIGGKNQTGGWLVDCCWKEDKLINKVRGIHEEFKDNVKITNIDFGKMITEPGENVLIYLDPPYYHEGNKLYAVGMSHEEHERLRDLLSETDHNFLLSYRDCKEIRELYKDKDKFILLEKTWTYSMMSQSIEGCKPGNELFIINKDFPIDIKNHMEIEDENKSIDEQIDEILDSNGKAKELINEEMLKSVENGIFLEGAPPF